MREQLLKEGFVRVFEPNARRALIELANKLKKEGHAIVSSEVEMNGRVTSAEAHHYKTCVKCQGAA